MTDTPETAPRSPFVLQGLGWFNVFFAAEFLLAAGDWISLNLAANALLIAALLVPLKRRAIARLRAALCAIATAGLLYAESWLPGWESLAANTKNILGFSGDYLLELAGDFVNWPMVAWGLVLIAAYAFLRNWLRVSVFTVLYFVAGILVPTAWQTFHPAEAEVAAAPAADAATAPETADAKAVSQWYDAFIDYEKNRRARIPAGLNEKDTPFDILILNICSLSNDDLAASELDDHGVFSRFNLVFDRFNSATSYSGPATLRLLNMACGQPSHDALYTPNTECQIMTRLNRLGFKERLYMDHSGEYDDYLKTLRDKAGLTAPLAAMRPSSPRYMAFDDEPLTDDLTMLREWLRTVRADKTAKRSVTLMNLLSLHDGNRLPRHGRSENFKPRAKLLLDQLQTFMRDIEKSGRRVMLIVAPEHGAAVRGDRIQMPRLRDIPSLRITQVPTLVKFFGVKDLPAAPVHVTGDTSYLALGDLIGRVLSEDFFGKDKHVDLADLAADLPRTNPVSENAQSQVLSYKGKDYLKRGDKPWTIYPH